MTRKIGVEYHLLGDMEGLITTHQERQRHAHPLLQQRRVEDLKNDARVFERLHLGEEGHRRRRFGHHTMHDGVLWNGLWEGEVDSWRVVVGVHGMEQLNGRILNDGVLSDIDVLYVGVVFYSVKSGATDIRRNSPKKTTPESLMSLF